MGKIINTILSNSVYSLTQFTQQEIEALENEIFGIYLFIESCFVVLFWLKLFIIIFLIAILCLI